MKFLLPHRFKKTGILLAPIGFLLWLAMQRGYITKCCVILFGHDKPLPNYGEYHTMNVTTAIIGFFSFLIGLYFISFSKEKIEDEMVQRTRMDSFQFAALVQLLIIIIGFLSFFFWTFENEEEGLLLLFILASLIFWLSFVIRFNYILHFKIKSRA